jgi:very-short-patch-repair endonuclease|tara:strand:+ start:696 stop:1082 length:387 start_codon:yes stop_codon:yes gene_type:complete
MNKRYIINKSNIKNIRRMNRNNPTPWEWKLWQFLKNKQINGYKFRRQVSINDFVVDFCCLELKFVIELDGSGHLQPVQMKKDIQRNNDLEEWGFMIMRFPNNDIDENLNAVINIITQKCNELHNEILK